MVPRISTPCRITWDASPAFFTARRCASEPCKDGSRKSAVSFPVPETTIAFLLAYGALLFGRASWLGDPMSIPLHQLQNGALLIFAFFMISDPKTSPNTAIGRCAYGTMVATVAYAIQFVFYEPNGAILALILSAPFVPLIDLVSQGSSYRWKKPARSAGQPVKGVY